MSRRGWRGSAAAVAVLFGCASPPKPADPDVQAIGLAVSLARAGELERAASTADLAVAQCGQGEAAFACAWGTHLALSKQFSVLGANELALDHARRATALTDAYGDAFSQYPTLALLAGAAARANELDEAEAALVRARATVEQLEGQLGPDEAALLDGARATLEGPQATLHLMRGEPAKAARAQTKMLAAVEQLQPEHPNLPVEYLNLAFMYEEAGAIDDAVAALERSAELAAARGNAGVEEQARADLDRLTNP